ncbi:ABC transporter permease subunit [Paraburkholderia fynbosensis]|uniref:Xylose transport system permease protein XylH n=1 Tax=Paraburkholderia fynbosensis TaxID=1200993 RepID=A0A6J5H8D7_9BURK|nr:ABC transporter permease [Paraburkholderia fynbosensis]CAB3810664.1 Xylose transport system permease protein XylH [Paraburkholderia fynbosensis]
MNFSTSNGHPVSAGDAATTTQAAAAAKTDWRRVFGLREMGVYYALILLVLVLSAVTAYTGRPNYLSIVNVTNVLYQASLIAIMAVAMTVILITGNFDLSVASVAALSAAVMIGLADSIGFVPAALVAMLVAVLAGVLNGAIVQLLGINAFIVTLGTLTAIRGIVLIVTDGRSLSVESVDAIAAMRMFESGRVPLGHFFVLLGLVLIAASVFLIMRARNARGALGSRAPAVLGILSGGAAVLALGLIGGARLAVAKPVVYMAVFTALVWFVLSFTSTGRRLYAVGGNAEAARLSGINVGRYKMAGFILCSAAAGFGGILFGSRLGAINPTALQGAELTVIASAILGGTSLYGGAGSVIKTLVGALLLFTLTNGFNILNLGANYQGVIEGTVVVTAAAIYTVGGSRRRARSR